MSVAVVAESRRWFEDATARRDLPPPREAASTHEAFKARLGLALKDAAATGQGNGQVVLASTKEELLAQIEAARVGGPLARRPSALEQFRRLSAAKNVYNEERTAGGKKVGRLAQEKANTFAQFVSAYSGVVDVIKTAGEPYGGVAFQTLSILLVVIINKTKNDNKVLEMMDEIRKSLPRLENWDRIYPTDEMRTLVAAAYVHITEFSRRAAQYFSRFWKRFTEAALPGISSSSIDETVSDIHKTLAEINAEAMVGLHKRSQRIEDRVSVLTAKAESAEHDRRQLLAQNREGLAQNEELKRQAEELRARIEDLSVQNRELQATIDRQGEEFRQRERQEDEQRLHRFEDFLGGGQRHAAEPGASLDATRKALMTVFPDLTKSSLVSCTNYTQMSRSVLLSGFPDYLRWRDCPTSSLLFLSGATALEGRRGTGYTHCWLSPAAVFVAEDALREGSKVAFFSCLPDLIAEPLSVDAVLASLVVQVLRWRPDVLRDHEEDFKRILRHVNEGRDGWTRRAKALVELLQGVLAEMQAAGTVYIVIDRLDRCREAAVHGVMDLLARLVTVVGSDGGSDGDGGSLRVKVAVVAETSGGAEGWRSKDLSEWDCRLDRLFVRQAWDQKRLTTHESSLRVRPRIWSSDSAVTI